MLKNYYYENKSNFGEPLMTVLELECIELLGTQWYLDIEVKMGDEYYYPYFCSIEKNENANLSINGFQFKLNYKINESKFKELKIEFELKNLITYSGDKMLEKRESFEEKIINLKKLNQF